tara:strand:+ start:311 stop:571 length:261 start_codon:yes stop_codon:yes gene_type:complete
MGKRYVVFFDGLWDDYGTQEPKEIKGYYANKQPNYGNWSFCEEINDAKLWKTKNGAQKRIDHQKECSYRELVGEIIEIEVEEMKIK